MIPGLKEMQDLQKEVAGMRKDLREVKIEIQKLVVALKMTTSTLNATVPPALDRLYKRCPKGIECEDAFRVAIGKVSRCRHWRDIEEEEQKRSLWALNGVLFTITISTGVIRQTFFPNFPLSIYMALSIVIYFAIVGRFAATRIQKQEERLMRRFMKKR